MLYFFVKSKILLASKTQTTLSPTGKSTTEFIIHFILHSFDMRKLFRCKRILGKGLGKSNHKYTYM